jgi:hypothetical protein
MNRYVGNPHPNGFRQSARNIGSLINFLGNQLDLNRNEPGVGEVPIL